MPSTFCKTSPDLLCNLGPPEENWALRIRRRLGKIEISEQADEYIKVKGFGSMRVVTIWGLAKCPSGRSHPDRDIISPGCIKEMTL